jgi:hypothetical protein
MSWLGWLIFGIAALLAGWVFAPPGLARRFAVVFPLAVLVGLVNPYIAEGFTLITAGIDVLLLGGAATTLLAAIRK